ncbi:hypothetical protein NHX12_020988, partial [Muraenolepis orangiensis]
AFSGNSNSESSVRHELQQGVVARFLRLVPLDWSEEGRIGLRADVINFDGQGVISYRFKSSESEGVILHGEGSNQYGSILGHTSVSSGSLLDDHHWHSVVIERFRRNVNFTLDTHTQHFRTNGEFDHLDLDYELPGRAERSTASLGFQFRTWNPDGLLLFSTLGDGTLEVALEDGQVAVHINTSRAGHTHRLTHKLQLVSRPPVLPSAFSGAVALAMLSKRSNLSDGQWHAVRLVAKENFAMLIIDGDEVSAVRTAAPLSVTTGGTYHLGVTRFEEALSRTQSLFYGGVRFLLPGREIS